MNHGSSCTYCTDVVVMVEPDAGSGTRFAPFLRCCQCKATWTAAGTVERGPRPRVEWVNTGARTRRRGQ